MTLEQAWKQYRDLHSLHSNPDMPSAEFKFAWEIQENKLKSASNVLFTVAKIFRRYEQLHKDKNTQEGFAKAATNAEHAILCEHAIVDTGV